LRNSDQSLCIGLDLTDCEHLAGITVVAVFDNCDIDIDDVTAFEHFAIIRDAMTHHMIDGRAD